MADRIIVIGSLNPERNVKIESGFFRVGYQSSNKGNGLQRSAESACGICDPYNKALYKLICPTLLASDYKHCKYVIEVN